MNGSKHAGMARKLIIVLLIGLTLASVHLAEGQQPTKVSRIGYLTGTTPDGQLDRIEAFRQGLRELGYVEGKNIVIEWRSAEGKLDRLPARAAELVRLKVDIIVTAGPSATRAAKEATNTIPIVISQDPDPVGNGFVASLARPGGNITGLSSLTADLSGKRLELLKEIIPKLTRVAVFGTSISTGSNVQQRREIELAAEAFKVQLQYLDVLDPKDIETAFQEASKGRADAVLVVPSSVLISRRKQVVELAVKSRLPAIYSTSQYVVVGGLMSYGVNTADVDRRAATYVDKILKGTKPADLPVEQPTKFELIINLKAAKQIGLTIPPNVLARADKVIK
jgi:putative tryptophan/tyrosine transport system substrate-binding protein